MRLALNSRQNQMKGKRSFSQREGMDRIQTFPSLYSCSCGETIMFQQNEIILASASPRRRELLALAGIPFRVEVSDVEEKITGTEPSEIVQELSLQKAEAVAEKQSSDCIVIGADTVVALDGRIMGKPKSREDAAEMLGALSGRAHDVFSGVSLLKVSGGEIIKRTVFFVRTQVHVLPLSPEEISTYVATGEPMDKAGAYGIQGRFCVHVSGITGDYYNVVGLPVSRVYEELRHMVQES